MSILKLGGKLTLSCRFRIVSFVCLIALLCVAAGLLGSFLLYGENSFDPLTLVVVDEEDSFESRLLLGYLDDLEGYEDFVLFLQEEDSPSARRLLEEGAVTGVITIPPEFVAGVMDGRNEPLSIDLNGSSSLRAGLVRLFADSYTDLLRTGQIGVYTALDAAWETGDEDAYRQMYRTANLRYLGAMLSRWQWVDEREVVATGAVSPGLYYGVAAFVFLLLLGSLLFLDVWAGASSRPVLLRLRASGKGALKTGVLFALSATIPFGAVCLLLLLLAVPLALAMGAVLPFGPGPLLSLPLLILCGGAFLFCAAQWLGSGAGAGAGVFLLSLAGLFLSGGVLPLGYFSPFLTLLSRLTPHYWLCRLLTEGLGGMPSLPALAACLGWVLLFGGLGIFGAWRKGKVGLLP